MCGIAGIVSKDRRAEVDPRVLGRMTDVLTHRGPYEGLGESYRWLYGVWLPASGREPRHAPPFEVYHNSPKDTPPDQLLTEIHLPLAPR